MHEVQAIHTLGVCADSFPHAVLWTPMQVNSGQYPGLMWDDAAKTMFRIPWKHAGKQDFRSDEDAAIFKAWAEFKGKLSETGRSDPASWKTRLRCALNKSPEFREVTERSQLDISEPYKVYRLVPISEQGVVQSQGRTGQKQSKKKRCRTQSDKEEENEIEEAKHMKVTSDITSVPLQPITLMPTEDSLNLQTNNDSESVAVLKNLGPVNEIQLNFMIETIPPPGDLPSLTVSIHYLGQEVLKRDIFGNDVRIAYYSSSPSPPPLSSLGVGGTGTERISLPEPPASLPNRPAFSALLPYMEKGVLLASTNVGIYAQRYCQGRVFWTGPHTSEPGPHKLERTSRPVMLFNRQTFQQGYSAAVLFLFLLNNNDAEDENACVFAELDEFSHNGGPSPQCGVTLCFGEELSESDDLASKLITVQSEEQRVSTRVTGEDNNFLISHFFPSPQISLPWATQRVQEAQSVKDSLAFIQEMTGQSPLGEVTLNLVSIA
ncbi:interferon regulatory factor 9-like [Scleropages formosus]|uniref:Interferon regulatory factor 9-like n=1 Tax=Scleropages formosus TaxID=113540 RepID=A0A0P7U1H5_SCLFO|nr:interferon regulatory factor 9-like [Scleropages formosus]